jgi:hypothetical protein
LAWACNCGPGAAAQPTKAERMQAIPRRFLMFQTFS